MSEAYTLFSNSFSKNPIVGVFQTLEDAKYEGRKQAPAGKWSLTPRGLWRIEIDDYYRLYIQKTEAR